MSITLIGFSALSGVPLFNRQQGIKVNESISFDKMARLNTLNHFSRLNESNLISTDTLNSSIEWKMYKGSIVLIVILTTEKSRNHFNCLLTKSNSNLDQLLDLIFDMVVLSCALDKLLLLLEKNVENFKLHIRHAYPIIDFILNQHFKGLCFDLLFNCIEYQIIDHNLLAILESLLDTFCKMAYSQYAFITINHKMIAGTKPWWSKIASSKDGLLIFNLVNSFNLTTNEPSKEVKIFLPQNCPNLVTRLMSFLIFPNTILTVLCASSPSLKELEEIIGPLRKSKSDHELFKQIQTDSRPSLYLNDNIINLIIVKKDKKIFTKFGNYDEQKLEDVIKLIKLTSQKSTKMVKHLDSFVHFRHYKGYHCEANNITLYFLLPLAIELCDIKKIAAETLTLLTKEKKIWP